MSESSSSRKRLPVRPSAENLRKQAKRLAKAEPSLPLAEAQYRIALEYGCKNWAALMHTVEVMNRGATQLSNVKREVEPLPQAVRARDVGLVRKILDSGDFTQHDLDAGLAHAAWYGGDSPAVLAVRKELFDLLLNQGADPDGQYGSAYGPIVFGTGECLSVDGLQWLIGAGCDVTFPPVDTKYGPTCALSSWLGGYGRGDNAAKYRGIDLLLKHHAFIPPEVTPEQLAIHRGDADGLDQMLAANASLAHQRYPDMPYGNILLRGATLLHAAVELGEQTCAARLLAAGADINATAEVIDNAGGQSPTFHAVASSRGTLRPMLDWLLSTQSGRIDFSLRCHGLHFSDGERSPALSITEYARWTRREGAAEWRQSTPEEIALLETAAAASGS